MEVGVISNNYSQGGPSTSFQPMQVGGGYQDGQPGAYGSAPNQGYVQTSTIEMGVPGYAAGGVVAPPQQPNPPKFKLK